MDRDEDRERSPRGPRPYKERPRRFSNVRRRVFGLDCTHAVTTGAFWKGNIIDAKVLDLWNRREFLQRSLALISAMHCGAGAVACQQSASARSPAVDPVEFSKLRLESHDLEAQRDFYRDVLSLPLMGETGDSVTFRAGRSALELVTAAPGTKPAYHFAFNIPENKLDRAIEWMSSRSPLARHPETGQTVVHFEHIDAHSVYFFDGAGNIVEFIARHRLRNSAPGAFGVEDILNLSEIGIVVHDVAAAVRTFESSLGLGVYAKSWPQFAPVGDVHGQFIVVSLDRVWLMTKDLKSAIYPTGVTLRGEQPDHLRLGELPYDIRLTTRDGEAA